MSRPRLKLGPHLGRGIPALILFVVFALVILATEFGSAAGLSGGVTEAIGFALLNIETDLADEGFLPALLLLALVLDAALDGAVHLASREDEGAIVTALAADHGADEHGERGGDTS